MEPLTVGILEDDARLRSVLERALAREGLSVRAVGTGHAAVESFSAQPPDVLVLDIGLPDADGRDVCQALRVHGVAAPVIFLTARDALTDRLSGFHVGGDDYVTKPFDVSELIARIRVALRRAVRPAGADDHVIQVDPVLHAVRCGERSERLTPTEFRMLAMLAARPGEVIRRQELRAAGWPDGAIVHDNTIDSYVARLRRKLARVSPERRIETRRAVGYILQ